MRQLAVDFAHRHLDFATAATALYRNTAGMNRIALNRRRNNIDFGAAVVTHCRILIYGQRNLLHIGDFTRLSGAEIYIHGSGNRLSLGERVLVDGAKLLIEGDRNTIEVGPNTQIRPRTNLVANGGSTISLGSDSAISSDVEIRSGDSHAILSLADGAQLNPAEDIVVGHHVWVGTRAILLKGAQISAHSVVGAGSLVTRRIDEENVILAGSPARVIKHAITWSR